MKNFRFTLLTLLLSGAMLAFGQDPQDPGNSASQTGNSYFAKYRPAKKWSLGLQISGTHTMSDADNFKPGWAVGGHVKYSVGQSFGLKLNGSFGTLLGNREEQDISGNANNGRNWVESSDPNQDPDNNNQGENFYDYGNQAPSTDSYFFRNNFRELNITTVYTLGNISFLRPLRKWQMYLFTGFGAIWSDVTGKFAEPEDARGYYNGWGEQYFTAIRDQNGIIQDAETNYQGRNFTIPFGLGIKRNFGRWLDLGIEYRNNWTRSDNLDGYSFPVWRNRYSDFYGLMGITASIKLGGTEDIKDHYDWLNPVADIYSTMDSLKELEDKVELLLVDGDGDGVADYYDKDPNTEEGAYTWANGVAADIDEDGVPDFRDDEPFSEKKSTVDEKGVMVDRDEDGIPDYRDDDPKSAPGVVVDRRGKEVEIGGGNACCNCDDIVLPSVIFDNGSSRIKPEFYGVLFSVAEKMKECPEAKIVLTGYAVRSKSGSQLARNRADAIVNYLNGNYNIPRENFMIEDQGDAPSGLEYSSRRIDMSQVK
jgi:outer membrane protein OmpA-like peptidoglycan-associated protein